MELKNVFLGAIFVFSTATWAAKLELGAYDIQDVTEQYPENNYYEQIQDCSDIGGGVPAAVTLPQLDNGNGIGSGSGFPFSNTIGPIGGGSADPGNGIVILPPGSGDLGNTIGGSIGVAPNLGGLIPGNTGIIIDQIVNIGNFAWSIVQQGRPSMRVSTFRAHGLPKGITCWTELEEWKIPKSKVFTVEQKNKLGQSMAKFTFRISYVYGGTYNGAGQYLANVTVSPVDLKVNWGIDFASEVQIPTVFNMGKKQNPLAAMQIFVYWGLGTAGRMQQKSSLFHVMGDGRIEATPQE